MHSYDYCDFSVISIYCYSCMHKYGFAVVLFLLLLLATVALYGGGTPKTDQIFIRPSEDFLLLHSYD